jgi:ankyrin repeat protein
MKLGHIETHSARTRNKHVLSGMAGFKALGNLAVARDMNGLQKLIDSGVDVNCRNQSGETLLHVAALSGDAEVLHLLLRNRADPNSRTDDRATPLHYAASMGHMQEARELLTAGADPQAVTDDGQTALHYAARLSAKPGIFRLLIDAGVDANARTTEGETAADMAHNPRHAAMLRNAQATAAAAPAKNWTDKIIPPSSRRER